MFVDMLSRWNSAGHVLFAGDQATALVIEREVLEWVLFSF